MKKNLHLAGILFLAAMAAFLTGFLVAWFARPLLQGDALYLVLAIALLGLIGAVYTLTNLLQTYVYGVRRLTEETRVIMSVNPSNRLDLPVPRDIKQLAHTINSFADRFQAAIDDQTEQIELAKANLEEEKNRLAALMSELTEGVLVFNLEGRILLYNQRARQMLRYNPSSTAGGYVGLGRSVFGLIDRNIITHIIDDLTERLKKQSTNLVSQVVITATNGQLVRSRTAPILNAEHEITGFVLTMEDVTQRSQRSRRRDMLLQALTEGVRSSLANIRTAIETIEQFPEMDVKKLRQMRRIIFDESLTLSSRLNEITTEYDIYLKSNWQLEEMLGSDLLLALQRQFDDCCHVRTEIADQSDNLWLMVDSFALVQALTLVVQRLKEQYGVSDYTLSLSQNGQLATLGLTWQNDNVDIDTLWAWQTQMLAGESNGSPPSLLELAERHGGEVWCRADKDNKSATLRMLFATAQPKVTQAISLVTGSRPEYYDFDLFHQPGQTAAMDSALLVDLIYTVFDTETTGLNPTEDEIISVSAVRIVNRRLLRQEVFDQLVDPKKRLTSKTTEITGISQEMVQGQPTIQQVLPQFHRFSENTVLLAHNAAFDMRMLQIKENATGVKFTNPVLDTLLLSAVTHPNNKDHSLEAIAQRLGVNIIGRHTSLGDAIVTGEIFLKLVPLLAEQGIVTLAQARAAAEKTMLARVKY
ncbi:MAG: exonuclease domain-containing protein [Anaerolineae bacterium]